MNISDEMDKARKELDGMVASFRPLNEDEHEAIKSLLLGIQTDAGMADSIRFSAYERLNDKMFAVTNNLSK